MSGESEEKILPPTRHKLKKAREKGQVVTSRETLSSVSSLAVLLYLFARREAIWRDLKALFLLEPAPGLTLMQDLHERARLAMELATGILAPIIALVIALAVLGGMAISGGPVFSMTPITPDFSRLNPASGFGKLFGRSAWMRLLMHVIRVGAIAALLVAMLWDQLGALMPMPPCGLACMGGAVDSILGPLLVGLTAILVVAGLLDYLVQRAEFIRQQRMSITEMKREYKDQDGNPQIKGALRQSQRDLVQNPTGLSQATLILRDGTRQMVALRYIRDDMPAPPVVARARGGAAGRAVRQALRTRPGLMVVEDAAAVAALSGVAVGDWISTDEQVAAVVPHLR